MNSYSKPPHKSNYKGTKPDNRNQFRPSYNKPIAKFSVYDGVFTCQKCKGDVPKARLWRDTLDLTWMCDCKYVSKVNLDIKGY